MKEIFICLVVLCLTAFSFAELVENEDGTVTYTTTLSAVEYKTLCLDLLDNDVDNWITHMIKGFKVVKCEQRWIPKMTTKPLDSLTTEEVDTLITDTKIMSRTDRTADAMLEEGITDIHRYVAIGLTEQEAIDAIVVGTIKLTESDTPDTPITP